MKASLTCSVDTEVRVACENSDENISALVNDFLRKHFEIVDKKDLDSDELTKQINECKIKLEVLELELKKRKKEKQKASEAWEDYDSL